MPPEKPTRVRWAALAAAALAQVAWAEMATLRVGAPPSGPPPAAVAPSPFTGRDGVRAAPPSLGPPVNGGSWGRETTYVARASGAIAADGRIADGLPAIRRNPPLDEDAWQRATRLSLSRTLDGSGAATQPTTVLLLRDAASLYVSFRCAEPQMAKLRAGQAGSDVDLWTSDSVEVFLGTGGTYFHFGVNPAGGTCDGRGKDSGWNLPLKAAVAREKDCWTAEMALPLDKLAGKEPPPVEWIANFNRTRYASGAVEEFAWSPTMSGDSHVPGRFGKLILAEPPARPDAEPPAAHAQPVEVLPAPSGVAVVRLDLSSLPEGAKVHRADLCLFRGVGEGDALAAIEVYPLADGFKEGVDPKPSGKPLALRAPWFDRLDATEAVRAGAARGAPPPHADLFIKAAPPLRLANTCLEVAYEGKPGSLPPQATGVKALHRAGQTFITWHDPADAFGDGPVTWGQLRDALRTADSQRQVRYRIYRHSEAIRATNIQDAVLLAEVAPLSGFNTNSWSLERLINQAVFGHEDQGELGVYGPFKGWSMDSPQGGKLVIPRFAIEDGKALPQGTGLHVHSAAAQGNAYYAVTAVADGVENLSEFSPANSLSQPVAEAPAAWEPVEQPAGGGLGFDFRGKRRFYVTWVAPPLAHRPMYFNWSVLVPQDAGAPCPVELYFHAPGYSYARPPVKFLEHSIQICPHDFPFSGWYGYNGAVGTLRSPADGVVQPYTIRRIEAFLKWAEGKFPIDRSRIVPVGGDGAALMALYRPELFAYVLITGFEAQQLDPKAAGRYVEAWGPASPRIRSENGLSEWAWGELDFLLCGKRLPAVVKKDEPAPVADPSAPGFRMELPLFVCRSYSWGRDPAYGHGRGRFYYALQATSHALHAHWAWGGRLTPPDKFAGLWEGLDIQNTTPVLAITNSSGDREGEGSGQASVGYTWRDVKEDANAFEASILGPPSTFDLTPRRLSRLRIQPGQKLSWQAAYAEVPHWARREAPKPRSGLVVADGNGLITLKGLEVATGYKLVVRIRRED